MSIFTFNTGIPASGNNPSVDQPVMLANNVATNGILGIDHVTFNTSNGGTHKQVTFSSENTPAAQTDPQSVLFTKAGTASTIADQYFVNQNATFLLNGVRAFAAVTGTTGALLSQSNISSCVRNSAGRYTITLNTNVVTGTGWGVVGSISQSTSGIWLFNYTIGGGGTVNIGIQLFTSNFTGSPADPVSFTILAYQV